MMPIVEDLEIVEFVVEKRRLRPNPQPRERIRLAAQLLAHLLYVVVVDVAVAAGPDELAHLQADLRGDEMGEQGITGEIERHTQEQIRTSLIELAGKAAAGDVEL